MSMYVVQYFPMCLRKLVRNSVLVLDAMDVHICINLKKSFEITDYFRKQRLLEGPEIILENREYSKEQG